MSNTLSALQSELVEKGSVRFAVRARPNAPVTKVLDVLDDESVKIAIKAPAEGGKANAELVRFLAQEFGVSREQVKIVSGASARHKLVQIKNC